MQTHIRITKQTLNLRNSYAGHCLPKELAGLL